MVKGLNLEVEVIVLPTVREADGLAMSSRNSYLNAEERRSAVVLFKALTAGRDLFNAGIGDVEKIKNKMQNVVREQNSIEIDYIEVADPETLTPLSEAGDRMVLLIAARLGHTRLIDNLLIL